MPMRRLASMSRTSGDTATKRENEALRKKVTEQDIAIRELSASLRMVAYNALPKPDITVNIYSFPPDGDDGMIAEPSLSVTLPSGNGSVDGAGKALLRTISSLVADDPSKALTFVQNSPEGKTWSDATGDSGVLWNFGAGFADPGKINVHDGSVVLYVSAYGVVYPVFLSEAYGELPGEFAAVGLATVPVEYGSGSVATAYDFFRCAYLVSGGSLSSDSSPVSIYLTSNDKHSNSMIESIISQM